MTPVRPGVKIVSSNVIRSTTTKSQLPRGVYRFRPDKGNDAILVVGIEPTSKTKVVTEAAKGSSTGSKSKRGNSMTPMKLYIDKMMSDYRGQDLNVRKKTERKIQKAVVKFK